VNKPQLKMLRCRRFDKTWTVDLAQLGKPDRILYCQSERLRIEVFRLLCPHCGNVEMLEVTFEECRNA